MAPLPPSSVVSAESARIPKAPLAGLARRLPKREIITTSSKPSPACPHERDRTSRRSHDEADRAQAGIPLGLSELRIRFIGDDDPTARRVLEPIVAKEEHAEDINTLIEELKEA